MKALISFAAIGLLLAGCAKDSPFLFQPSSPAAAGVAAPEASATSVRAAAPGKILVLLVVGDVKLIDAAGNARSLVKGDIFLEGNTIMAGPNAGATLVFSNGVTLRVTANTQVAIDKFRQAPFDETKEGTFIRLQRDPSQSVAEINLQVGSVQGEVKQLNKTAGSTFQIDTPNGTHAVDGIFSLTVPEANANAHPLRG